MTTENMTQKQNRLAAVRHTGVELASGGPSIDVGSIARNASREFLKSRGKEIRAQGRKQPSRLRQWFHNKFH
jgi:hypothetical protein